MHCNNYLDVMFPKKVLISRMPFNSSMKLFKNDGQHIISPKKPIDVSLKTALTEIDTFPSDEQQEGTFIGFINEKNETIQFIRFKKDTWLIDVPILKGKKFYNSLQESDLSTKKTKQIVRKFFSKEDWKSECYFNTDK